MIERSTNETSISLSLELHGKGRAEIDTGCGYQLDEHGNFTGWTHMTEAGEVLFEMQADNVYDGDMLASAEYHYTRYGSIVLPMDEALVLCAADLSGRGGFYGELSIPTEKVGDFDTELCEEFFIAFAREAGITLHLRQLTGKNSHHILEACFKAVARSLKMALSPDTSNLDSVPSTKGVL